MNNHTCADRTCLFCKALSHQRWDKKATATRVRPDEQVYKRAWEVTHSSQIEATKNSLASSSLEEMETYVLLDKATGLYNFRTLTRELGQEIQRAQRLKKPLSLCMIAIDGFEDFARHQGSLTVDAVLKSIANSLKKTIREIDVPCRYTAEKFAIILPETNISGAMVAAERIQRRMSAELAGSHGLSHRLVVSAAIAAYPIHGRKQEELIEQGSKALNFAVIQGGTCIVEATVIH